MNFKELRAINVNEHTENKNGFTYLSWAWAVDQMLQQDETATWEYMFFGPEDERRPFCKVGETAMVFCKVTMFGRTRIAQMPVIDFRNKAIAKPDSFAINTAMMRALAKGISLHGIGLYIYAGEDLPDSEAEHIAKANITPIGSDTFEGLTEDLQIFVQDAATEVGAMCAKGDIKGAADRLDELKMKRQMKTILWPLLTDSAQEKLTAEFNARKAKK